MPIPSRFTISSDYATLKNDDGTSTSVVFPGSSSIAGSSYKEVIYDLTIGAQASINSIEISSSKDSNTRYTTLSLGYTRTGTVGGVGTPYGIYAFAYRTSTTNLRCSVYVPNPSGSTLITAATDETFTFYIDTTIPPFSS